MPTNPTDNYENNGAGGGGGGATTEGEDAGVANDVTPFGSKGGEGLDLSAFVGTTIGDSGWFAGGGSTDIFQGDGSEAPDMSGFGGGGRGLNTGSNALQAGMPNTGGGGGGGGGVGGSGIVIFIT